MILVRPLNNMVMLIRMIKMKVLSIKQPWAWAIIEANKDIENRTWSTKFRGRVLVHASKKFDRDGFLFLFDNLERLGIESLPLSFKSGGIIGSVELIDCVQNHSSPWFVGPYGFILNNPKSMDFIPCKGKLGFFEYEE